MLAAMSNGITHTSGNTLDQKPFSNSADGSWSINGGIGSTVEFLLDGAPNNTIYNGVSTVANVPSVDAVQEFKVMTSTYDAQYGHTGGGAINISIKSGTNSFHGTDYEYLKRATFNAAAFLDNAHGNPSPSNALDQYGFTIGGPVSLPKLYKGKHVFHSKIEVVRTARVEVDAAEHLPIELDGEQVGTTPARFELVPGALRVRVPRSS